MAEYRRQAEQRMKELRASNDARRESLASGRMPERELTEEHYMRTILLVAQRGWTMWQARNLLQRQGYYLPSATEVQRAELTARTILDAAVNSAVNEVVHGCMW